MAKSQKTSVGRRGFLKNAAAGAAGAAALVTTTPLVEAQAQGSARASWRPAQRGAPAPTQAQLDREAGNVRPPAAARTITRPGSDLMVQTIQATWGSNTWPPTRDRVSKACRNRSSITAIRRIRCRSSSPRCTKSRR